MKFPMLQDVIHQLETGPWGRRLKISLAVLTLLGLVVGYNFRSFRNFSTPEAMDSAQVARNLAEGNGYSTSFIRPVSLHLVKKQNLERGVPVPDNDYAQVKGNHPDLANPPLYPCVLAVMMKVLPFRFEATPVAASADKGFMSKIARGKIGRLLFGIIRGDAPGFYFKGGNFWRYQPDFLIALFNEFLMFVIIALMFLLAKRLFDPTVAWMTASMLLVSELLWRFSTSGLSTMLLMLIMVGLAWCLVWLESEAREPKWGKSAVFLLAAGAGVLLALGMLTRYSFGWLIVPVTVWLIFFGGQRRAALCLLTIGVFAIAAAPWIYRNVKISGLPFGTATYAVVQGTPMFPEYKLDRTLEPDFSRIPLSGRFGILAQKLLGNTGRILQNDIVKLGGSWLGALFLAGLMIGFRSPAIRRLRYLVVMCLAMLVIVQAMGRTQLSEDMAEVNTENLLVLLLPFVSMYGVSLFFLALDQMNLPYKGFRFLVIGLFGFIMSLPMIFTFFPPKPTPVVYPPYYPPAIQQVSGWMKENELMMSDIPWAVAWYGRRQCMWTTLNAQEDFFAVNDLIKPVRGLYLTPQTMDSRFLTQWVRAGEHSWGSFILESMMRKQIPPTFPLREAPAGFLPEQLFLTDWKRWRAEPTAAVPSQPADASKPKAPEATP